MEKKVFLAVGVLVASVLLAGCVGEQASGGQSYSGMTPEQVISHLDSKIAELNKTGQFYFKGSMGFKGTKGYYEVWADTKAEKLKMKVSVPGEGSMTMLYSDKTLYMYDVTGTAKASVMGDVDCLYYSVPEEDSGMENVSKYATTTLKSKGAEFKGFKDCTINGQPRTCAEVHYIDDNGDDVTAWYTMEEGYPVKVITRRGSETTVNMINEFKTSVPSGVFEAPKNCVSMQELLVKAMNKSAQEPTTAVTPSA